MHPSSSSGPDAWPCALTIAGSDSGGGAGIQADLKTFAAHGVHGLCAIAALTAQHTRGVTAVHVPPHDFLRAQIGACFDDFEIGAVKIGMLANAEVINAVADALAARGAPPLVLDPVMIATSGARLLEADALEALRTRLLPGAAVLTPNLPEAEFLLSRTIPDRAAMGRAAADLLAAGARAVLLKGGHLQDGADEVVDLLAEADGAVHEFSHPRLPRDAHGTGCSLASAIAANLCRGMTVRDACDAATGYVHRALCAGYPPGRSEVLVLDHIGAGQAPSAS